MIDSIHYASIETVANLLKRADPGVGQLGRTGGQGAEQAVVRGPRPDHQQSRRLEDGLGAGAGGERRNREKDEGEEEAGGRSHGGRILS